MTIRLRDIVCIFILVASVAVGIFLFIFFCHLPKNLIPIQEYTHTQILDHSSYGLYSRFFFPQRVFIEKAHWKGPNSDSPIFVYLGGQTDTEDYVRQIGLINKAAPQHKALVFYIEHRFYGEWVPYESIETEMAKPKVRGYLTVDQVLSDYVDIIVFLKTILSHTHRSSSLDVHPAGDLRPGLFGSNIVFSNGLKDPNSFAGVLEDISTNILAINIKEGSHCTNLHLEPQDDPEWLADKRTLEVKIITGLIKEAQQAYRK